MKISSKEIEKDFPVGTLLHCIDEKELKSLPNYRGKIYIFTDFHPQWSDKLVNKSSNVIRAYCLNTGKFVLLFKDSMVKYEK